MTLREAMKDAHGMIAISLGVGYFFIGEKDEWDELKDYINNKQYQRHLKKHPTEQYTPLEQREVKDVYETDFYGYYVIILESEQTLKGYWDESFWMKHEFDEVYDPVKKDLRSRG